MSLCAAHFAELQGYQAVRAKLISGQATAAFEYAGQRQEFSKPDLNRLDGAIASLEAQATQPGACGACPSHYRRRRARAITWAA